MREVWGLTEYEASVLTSSVYMAELFGETAKRSGNGRRTASWLMGETMRRMREEEVEPRDLKFSPEHLAALIRAEDEGRLTPHSAKKVFAAMFQEDVDPEQYMGEQGLAVVRDEKVLEEAVDRVLARCEKSVEEYRGGKEKVFSFLVGQVMREMRGQADAESVRRMLLDKLKK